MDLNVDPSNIGNTIGAGMMQGTVCLYVFIMSLDLEFLCGSCSSRRPFETFGAHEAYGLNRVTSVKRLAP